MTTSGYRAHSFESIEAPDKGAYLDKTFYLVDGLPGMWRRVKLPKGDPAAVGLLQCWYIDGPIALEYHAAATEELATAVRSAALIDPPEGVGSKLVQELRDKRTEFLIAEKSKVDGAPVAEKPTPNASSTASNEPGAPADGPPATAGVNL